MKEELLKRRGKLVKDKEELQKSSCLYYVPNHSNSFYNLELSSEYIVHLIAYINTEILNIDTKLGI